MGFREGISRTNPKVGWKSGSVETISREPSRGSSAYFLAAATFFLGAAVFLAAGLALPASLHQLEFTVIVIGSAHWQSSSQLASWWRSLRPLGRRPS